MELNPDSPISTDKLLVSLRISVPSLLRLLVGYWVLLFNCRSAGNLLDVFIFHFETTLAEPCYTYLLCQGCPFLLLPEPMGMLLLFLGEEGLRRAVDQHRLLETGDIGQHPQCLNLTVCSISLR